MESGFSRLHHEAADLFGCLHLSRLQSIQIMDIKELLKKVRVPARISAYLQCMAVPSNCCQGARLDVPSHLYDI
jgi:hypothetical protein